MYPSAQNAKSGEITPHTL